MPACIDMYHKARLVLPGLTSASFAHTHRWNAEQPDMGLLPLRSFNLQLSTAFADPLAAAVTVAISLHDDHAWRRRMLKRCISLQHA